MPELPDVETFGRYLAAHGQDRRIAHTHVEAEGLLDGTSPQGMGRRLKGHALTASRRHGKYLFARRGAADDWLVLHFGMSGFLQALEEGEDLPSHAAMALLFEDGGALAYVAPRKLGRIGWAQSPEAFAEAHELGPDALAIDRSAFVSALQAHRGGTKCWLMDQSAIAGIGNVHSDEVLFQAGIHPKRRGRTLSTPESECLYDRMREVLEQAIAVRARPERLPEGYLLPLRGEPNACPRCGDSLSSIKACGRTAWLCPSCQPEGG